MLRRSFDLLAILSFVLFVPAVSLWMRQYHPLRQPDRTLGIQLDRRLPSLQLEGARLIDVIDFMADVSGANIDVNWPAVRAAGISPDQPVHLHFSNVKCSIVFASILDSVGLGYALDHSTLCVSTREDLKRIGTVYRPTCPWPSNDDLRSERALHEAWQSDATAAAIILGAGWIIGRRRFRRRPHGRKVFGVATVLFVACGAGIHAWLLRTTQLQAVAFDRRFTIAESKPGSFGLSIEPVAIPWGRSWRETADTGPRVYFSGFALRFERTGSLSSELRATAPCAALAGFLLACPALWAFITVQRAIRSIQRQRAGQCTHCGYDVRATPGRCPECGRPVPAKAEARA